MTRLQIVFQLVRLAVLILVVPTPGVFAAGPQGTQPGWAIDNAGNILITEDVADRLAQSGAGWVRVNFRLGPYPADTVAFYAAYDTIVDRLRIRGLQIVALLCNEGWPGDQSQWTENNWENGRGDGFNNYIDGFGHAFARMAAHWEGRIRFWEIWNEPDCWSTNPSSGVYEGCSYIYPSNFAALLTHCHALVHYYSSLDVQIISGGLFGHDIGGFGWAQSGAAYLDNTYSIGISTTGKFTWAKTNYGSYPLDAVGQHLYINAGDSVNATWFGTYLDYIHNVVTNWEGASSSKKTWVTEFGWTTAYVSENRQGNNLKAAYDVIQTRGYVAGGLWFQLDDNPAGALYYGLFQPSLTKKASWARFNSEATYEGIQSSGVTNTVIRDYFNSHGGLAVHGSPFDHGGTAWVHWWDYGYVQDFDGGSIGPCAIFDTGHRVAGGFWQAYLQGSNHPFLRFPISEEYSWGAGTRQDFQTGYMTWDPANGVQAHPTRPLLGQPLVGSGSFTFTLPTESGFSYEVQSKTNLNETIWTLERTVSGDGTVKSIGVPTGPSRKFIRVAVRL
jgi:hypothetical protein